MWATTTLSRLWPPATASGFIVSARYSRPRKNIKYDYDDEEEEEEDEEEEEHKKEIGGWKQQELVDSDEEQAKISGSAVLLALQKASAKKISKKTKKKKREVDDKRPIQGNTSTDYAAVKPLRVKSDWNDRLDELETGLHQLTHNA